MYNRDTISTLLPMGFIKKIKIFRALDFSPLQWWHFCTYALLLLLIYYFQEHELLIFIITCLFIGSFFYDIIGYLFFQGWEKRLPFTLEGWEDFVSQKKIIDPRYWTEVEIFLEIIDTPNISKEEIISLLDFFIQKANKNFYSPESVNDPRHKWKVSNTMIYGSMNILVAKEFYFFLCKKLAPLERKKHFITSVSLKIKGGEPYYIEQIYIPD